MDVFGPLDARLPSVVAWLAVAGLGCAALGREAAVPWADGDGSSLAAVAVAISDGFAPESGAWTTVGAAVLSTGGFTIGAGRSADVMEAPRVAEDTAVCSPRGNRRKAARPTIKPAMAKPIHRPMDRLAGWVSIPDSEVIWA